MSIDALRTETRASGSAELIEWDEVAAALRGQSRDRIEPTLRGIMALCPTLDLGEIETHLEAARLGRGAGKLGPAALVETFASALEAARPVSDAVIVTAAYAYLIILDAWERTQMWSDLDDVLQGFLKAANAIEGADPDEALLLEGLLLRVSRMSPMLWVESAINSSSATDVEQHAKRVLENTVKTLNWVSRAEQDLPERYAPVREELRRAADADHLYYDCLIAVAEAVDAFNASPSTAGGLLGEAIRKLEHAEHHPSLAAGPVAESELMAHRLTLIRMVECMDRPFLHAGKAELVYCYPFTMPGVDWSTIESAFGTVTTDWSLEADGRTIAAESVRYMPLTDMWLYSSRDQRGHRGIELSLMTPQVRGDEESDRRRPVYGVTLRLSALGNHYVRIERCLLDATLHDIYAAMRSALGRAFVVAGDAEWASLRAYAETAFHGLAEWLSGAATRTGDGGAPAYDEDMALRDARMPKVVTAQDAAFYVILSITEPLITEPDGTRRAIAHDDLTPGSGVVGASLLAQPVRQTVCALDEWIRYRVPEVSGMNLFSESGFAGDVAVSTRNTTIFVRTSMPHWLLLEYVEMAEFAASLAPLLEARRTILANSRRHIHDDELPELEKALMGDLRIRPEAHELQSLAVQQLQAIRAEASFLRSGELVRTAVHRDFLDRVLANSRVPQLESEILLELDRLSTLYANVAAQARLIGERYQRREDFRREEDLRRGRSRLELVLVVLAALALFEFWSFFNMSFKFGADAALIEIGLTVVVVLVLVLLGSRLLMAWSWRGPRLRRQAANDYGRGDSKSHATD